MEKEKIKKMAIILALVHSLTLATSVGVTKLNNSKKDISNKNEYSVMDENIIGYDSYIDENGMKRETIEISPIITHYMEPVKSMKNSVVDGKTVSEEVTTYVQRTMYSSPSCATRVEGSGANMRCFIDYGMRPITSQKVSDGKTEDVITYSYGLIYPEFTEEDNSLKLHR
ncbi:MAG: hypothetical protein IKR57_02940 [Bacilli bacterium]|nr:hypothetical protein [Bacilli bacterium]